MPANPLLKLSFIICFILFVASMSYFNSHRDLNSTQLKSPTQEGVEAQNLRYGSREYTVTITSNGFDPSQLTIRIGDKVTWINNDSKLRDVSSDPHPTHTDYEPLNELNFIKSGESKSFIFDTPGVYRYHDHLFATERATVTVTE